MKDEKTEKKQRRQMNSPTEPQEKRVVPLLMVWMSRCGGRHVGRRLHTCKMNRESREAKCVWCFCPRWPQSNENFVASSICALVVWLKKKQEQEKKKLSIPILGAMAICISILIHTHYVSSVRFGNQMAKLGESLQVFFCKSVCVCVCMCAIVLLSLTDHMAAFI